MGWNQESSKLEREPEIINDDESTEVVFNASPAKTKGEFFGRGNNAICEDEEDAEAGRPPLKETDEETTEEKRRQFLRRAIVVICLVIIALAIALGIIFGRKDNSAPINTTNKGVDNQVLTTLISNDQCRSASTITPDGSSDVGVITSGERSTFTNGEGECGAATFGSGPGKWYEMVGLDSTLSLSACAQGCTVPDDALVITEVSVFSGNCDALDCIDGIANLAADGPLTFSATEGKSYYIYIQGGGDSLGFFELKLGN